VEDFFCDYSRFAGAGAGDDELVAAGAEGGERGPVMMTRRLFTMF